MLATEKKLDSLMQSDDLQSGRWTKEVKVLTILFAKNPARPGNSRGQWQVMKNMIQHRQQMDMGLCKDSGMFKFFLVSSTNGYGIMQRFWNV